LSTDDTQSLSMASSFGYCCCSPVSFMLIDQHSFAARRLRIARQTNTIAIVFKRMRTE